MPQPHRQDNSEVIVHTLTNAPQKPINETQRFVVLVLGSFCCICCSFSYAFNLISTPMQEKYDLTQREMSTIVSVGLVSQYFGLPYAFLYDFFGPVPISVLTVLFFSSGSLLLAQAFAGNIDGGVWHLAGFNALVGCGCHLYDFSPCTTVLSHFPTRKGAVTALLKTFSGLGSAIVGSIYLAFFAQHTDWYFYFLAGISGVVGGLSIFFMRLPKYHLTIHERSYSLTPEEIEEREATKAQYLRQDPPTYRFIYGFVILAFLIAFLPTQGALVAYLKLGQSYRTAFAIIVILATLAFALVPFYPAMRPSDRSCADYRAAKVNPVEPTLPAVGTEIAEASVEAVNGTGPVADTLAFTEKPTTEGGAVATVETDVDYVAPQYQTSFLRSLRTPELWLLMWTFFCIQGTVFVIIYNATFVLAALDGKLPDSSLRTLLTVLNGAGSAVGRLVMSYLEYWSQNRPVEDRIPITFVLFLPTTAIIITIILFLTLPGAALPLPYVVAALGNGFCASSILLVSRTVYAKDPAMHYNFCSMAIMFSTIVLNRFLYGEWIATQAEKQGSKVCYGKNCVLMPLLVLLGLACTAFISNIFVHLRYRAYCQRVIVERSRIRDEAQLQVAGTVPEPQESVSVAGAVNPLASS